MGEWLRFLVGPPCRSVSRLRHRAPGPRPVRGRDDRRLSLSDLTVSEKELVVGDLALLLKQCGLWLMAWEAWKSDPAVSSRRPLPPAFLMEFPRDAADYMEEESVEQDSPSFWNFRDVKDMTAWMKATYVHLDQGAVGHAKRKPTTLLVANMSDMEELQGISGEGTGQETAKSLHGRLLQSREWSAWAPGLVAAIQESLIRYLRKLDEHELGESHEREAESKVSKLDIESWKEHVRNQHRPYRRDCRRCMEMMGIDAPHRRGLGDKAAHCLSYDILGPMPQGEDVGMGTKVKYIMVATVAVPKLPKDLSEPVGVQNITVVEPLESRSQLDEDSHTDKLPVQGHGGEYAEGPHRQRVCISVEGISVFLQEVWPLSNHDGRR